MNESTTNRETSIRNFTANDGSSIPAYMWTGLARYIELGEGTGDFLMAVLQNNLKEAISHGDENNQRALVAYVEYLYNHAPSLCWGSRSIVNAWMGKGGCEGIRS